MKPVMMKTTGVRPSAKLGDEAERVVDRRADVAVGGREERVDPQDALETMEAAFGHRALRSVGREAVGRRHACPGHARTPCRRGSCVGPIDPMRLAAQGRANPRTPTSATRRNWVHAQAHLRARHDRGDVRPRRPGDGRRSRVSGRRRSSASATRPSAGRPAAGPATRTAAPTTSTRSGRAPTGTRRPASRSPGCHRSKANEIAIGGGINSANLACSGARTYTQPFSSGSDFKPGLDFYDDGAGHLGQAKTLQQYAATHNVKLVVVLIGANNYGFADIVQSCVVDFLTSPTWWQGLLLRRLQRQLALHGGQPGDDHHPGRRRVPEPAHGDAQRRLRRQRVDAGRPDLLVARSRAARPSATRSPATRASPRAAAASGTATPTGPTTPPWWR